MRPTSFLAFTCLAVAATGQSVVLPASAATTAGTSSNVFPWGTNASAYAGMRIQCLYDSSHFTGAIVPVTAPILITNVRWRANDTASSWAGGTYANASLTLATASVDHTAATTDMSANLGADAMVVYRGPVVAQPGTGNGTGVPGPFVVDIAINPPFYYDPNAGDLVVDTDYLSGTFTGGTLVALDTTGTAPLARRVYCSTNYPVANGIDTAAPVIEVAYTPVPAGTPASIARRGAGCINVPDTSFYELFATSAAFDLANTAISLLHTADGYLAIPGITVFVPPTPSAQVLALTDNSNVTVTLPAAMPVSRALTTTTLGVNSNGFVTAGTVSTTTGTPSATTLLNSQRAIWAIGWHDMNPTIAGGGQVLFEELGGVAYVTWNGVWDNSGTTAANANTMQAQFEVATGNVHFVYQSMSALGNARLVGYSDPAGSPNPGSMDISAALPTSFQAASFRLAPLGLGATSRPVIGTNWNLEASDIPAPGLVGIEIWGTADPLLNDLTFLGMPGCGLRATLDLLGVFISTGTSHAYGLTFPNNPSLLNLHVYANAAILQPGVNAFGAITSNGIDGRIGDV